MTPKYAEAASQYIKDPQIRKEDVKILLDWLEKQQHLPKITEYQVILFLQSCYYRIEVAKTSIENHYSIRSHCPEFFANRSLSSVETLMRSGLAYLLPEPSLHGYSVMFAKLVDPNPDHFNCNDLIKYFDMVVSLILRRIGVSQGHVLVIDMNGTTFAHIAKINVNSARKHDIVEMLHIHGSIDGLYDFVPKEALAKEYGGQGGSIQEIMAEQRREFEENESYFLEEETQIADESKRIGNVKKVNEIFGSEGTFRRISID
ncbi:alpha-tocopherol transfer protein-related [Holotrichia oblita]|uniref:Alpha-tocopherol transfer protein-related n=1 Tax=Holotrichia oblita TaxID=644536 RepID=A0ACB9SHL8_HOLOL|nr:alpha-tocopherol transfer protein-related [Holotrichia oblita]